MGSEGEMTIQKAPTLITVVNKKTVKIIENTENKCVTCFWTKVYFKLAVVLLQLF